VSRTLVWKGLDAPRMEIAHVELGGDNLRARGTQIGSDYELRYEVEEPRLHVEVVGAPLWIWSSLRVAITSTSRTRRSSTRCPSGATASIEAARLATS
jgi:hypothetical protein